jgi:hypothetical protein
MKRYSFNLSKQVLNPYVFVVWLVVSHNFPAEQSQSSDVTLSEVDAWPVDLELARQLRRIITVLELDIELSRRKIVLHLRSIVFLLTPILIRAQQQ